MPISSTYREMLIEDYIKEQLSLGVSITAEDVISELETFLDQDLSIPQFSAANYLVERLENSSAQKNSETLLSIRQDLRVLYKHLLKLTTTSSQAFERWHTESSIIEKQLLDLEDRIQNLLLLTQDTEGYHSVIIDNFTDFSLVDTDFSTAEPDIETKSVELSTSGNSFQRIFLNNLIPGDDVTFRVRNTLGLGARSDQGGTTIADIFHQESKVWWTNISMSKNAPVVCELTVKLSHTGLIDLGRIVVDIHDSAESSLVSITPLYSKDNINFAQLPSTIFTIETRSNAIFTFPQIQAQYIKFILVKAGPDQSNSRDSFNYQFGFKNIRFYTQAFDTSTAQYFISKPLSALDIHGEIKTFEKLVLEVCECIQANTDIKYYITTSNNPLVPLVENDNINLTANWIPISPINRQDNINPTVLDIGDSNEIEIGLLEDIKISYDGLAASGVNPATTFSLLSQDVDESILEDLITATETRYAFANSNDRLLNYQIKLADTGSGTGAGVDLLESSLVIFRNLGEQGIAILDTTKQVRGIQSGWGYQEPYYYCVIEIQNPEGMTIDVGTKSIIIDNESFTGLIDNTVLTGKTNNTTGLHRIKIHKSNWLPIDSLLDTLDDILLQDKFYPYNQKLLIEGYSYGTLYPDTSPKVYTGVDLFAETIMKRVSPFDMYTNIPKNNYEVYALDKDAPNTHTGGNSPTQVFLIKIDEQNPDSQNERFVIRFKQINLLQKYLRLRADLSSNDITTTPALFSYKIKLG